MARRKRKSRSKTVIIRKSKSDNLLPIIIFMGGAGILVWALLRGNGEDEEETLCTPGQTRENPLCPTETQTCNADGTAWVGTCPVVDPCEGIICDPGERCVEGICEVGTDTATVSLTVRDSIGRFLSGVNVQFASALETRNVLTGIDGIAQFNLRVNGGNVSWAINDPSYDPTNGSCGIARPGDFISCGTVTLTGLIATISIQIRDQNTLNPISGASVAFDSSVEDLTRLTDANGRINVDLRVRSGGETINITASRLGYNSNTMTCYASPGEYSDCGELRLSPAVVGEASAGNLEKVGNTGFVGGNTVVQFRVTNVGDSNGFLFIELAGVVRFADIVSSRDTAGSGGCGCFPGQPTIVCSRNLRNSGNQTRVEYILLGDWRGRTIEVVAGHSSPPDETTCSEMTMTNDEDRNFTL